MTSVLHFRKELVHPPVAVTVTGVRVRNLALAEDVPAWLALRGRAMAGQTPSVRPWSPDDFRTEMSGKPWWRPEWSWSAVPYDSPEILIGSVTLGMREGASTRVPVVHWLLVDPAWRRRGIGRLLMSHLERAAWDAGWREVALETHAGWSAAVAFYQSIGYAPERDPSS